MDWLEAGYGSEGSLLIAFDTYTWEHAQPVDNEMEALSQYTLGCTDDACTEPILTEIGPIQDPENPAGNPAGFQLIVYGILMADQSRANLVYEAINRLPSIWFDFLLAQCAVESGCQPDPASDPVLFSVPGDTVVGISGEASFDAHGAAMFAMGAQLPGEQWRILLIQCQTTECAEPLVNWLNVPNHNKSIRDVDVVIDPDGVPVLAYTDHVGDQLDLHLVQCADAECSDFMSMEVARKVRRDWDLSSNLSGIPYLVWGDVDTDEAIIAACADTDCTRLNTVRTGLTGTEDWLPSLAVAPDGYPMLTFHQPRGQLQLFNCLPEICSPLNS